MKWAEADWNGEPWWEKVFGRAWCGVVREARQAGLTRSEARAAAERIVDELFEDWSAYGAEMTVGMFKVRVLTLARARIAELVRSKTDFRASAGERPPHEVSEAWRERYRWSADD